VYFFLAAMKVSQRCKEVLPKNGLSAIENQAVIDILSVDEHQYFQLVRNTASHSKIFFIHPQARSQARFQGRTQAPEKENPATRAGGG